MNHLPSLTLKACLAIAITTVGFSAQAADADAGKAFAKQNNCLRCHGIDKDKDGPAFTKVAAKYKADPKAVEKLLHHLSSGENAKFPDGHEEAHMILKADDPKEAQNLVEWILSL